jgi:hypothetical protein
MDFAEDLDWILPQLLLHVWVGNGHGAAWLPDWGPVPATFSECVGSVRARLRRSPPLLPMLGHRRLVVSRDEGEGHAPVISIHGTDTIVYGYTLRDYLIHEFQLAGASEPTDAVRARLAAIPFWGPLLDYNGYCFTPYDGMRFLGPRPGTSESRSVVCNEWIEAFDRARASGSDARSSSR